MTDRAPRVLVIAPHPDDETLGAGGTIARVAAAGGEVTVLTVAVHMPPLYPPEVQTHSLDEARRAHAILNVKNSIFRENPALLLGEVRVPDLNASIVDALGEAEPDLVLLPFLDRHIDHRLVFEAAMVATRPVGPGRAIKVLAAYETLSGTHWNAPHVEANFAPNWYVDVRDHLEAKIEAMRCYTSQMQDFPCPRSPEALRALALFRGSLAGMAAAEAFYVIRMTCPPEMFV
jgi:LmbE family N-acetylglucosaminyl deacetylase